MARTAITPVRLARNGGEAEAQVTIDQANGMVITANPGKTMLRVSNTSASAANVIVRAGSDDFLAWMAGQGDLTTSVAASGVSYFGPFESARVVQPGGLMNIDFGAGFTGKIAAVELP